MINKNLISFVTLGFLIASSGFKAFGATAAPTPKTQAQKSKQAPKGKPAPTPDAVAVIVAKVGSSAITKKDVLERIKLTILTSGLKDSPSLRAEMYPQVLKGLMDERTQLFETAKYKFEVPEAEVGAAIENLAKDNNMAKQGLLTLLQNNKIDPNTLKDRLRAQIAWVRYVRARFGAQAEVASEEVRKKQEEIQKVKDLKQYEVCEIFIRAANPQEMAAAKARANVLYHQLSSGAPFRALAHEASDSISRNNGGYLGWMTHGQWNPALQSAVETIQPGAFSSPVEATGGIYILYLASVKQAGEAAPSRKAVSYLEARVPVTQNSTPEQIEKYLPVVEALKSAKGVKAFEDAAKAAGVVVTRHDKVSLDAINGYIQSHLNGAKGVIIDPPAMTPDGLYMAMISSIEDIKAELPKDDDVKAHLEQERLMKFSVREMARLDAGVFKEILIPTPKDIL